MERQKLEKTPVFILAGGKGTRIMEESQSRPKPMIEIGDIPILVHIMRWYYKHGFNDFIICGGYRVWEIKQYFLHYEQRTNHLSIDHRESLTAPATSFGVNTEQERWRVRVVDTGLDTMTGSRIAQAVDVISKTDQFENFAVTYGDGLSNIDLKKAFEFHTTSGKLGSTTGIALLSRFGELVADEKGKVKSFVEKPVLSQSRVNGGFMFFKKEFTKYLSKKNDCILEQEPLKKLAEDGQLMLYTHDGFWHPMDTLRDREYLQGLWNQGQAPWKV